MMLKTLERKLLAASFVACMVYAVPQVVFSQEPKKADDFQEKIETVLERTEKSIKLIREQIVQNQSAPFLADLYLQLGDLLQQKSTSLYYLQMERDNNTELKTTATKKFSPIIAAEKEAIEIYRQILREFPKFEKREKVLYRLALALKSIDEGAAFAASAEQLIKEHPKSKEAIQARLFLGQHFFDMNDFAQAMNHLNPVQSSSYPYERNAARYRIGLIYLAQEKHEAALRMFEKVATDDEFKEDDNPQIVSLKTKTAKTNLKREALIDSIRAYTSHFKENPDPVGYYAKVAPTETLFQETIEKLAYRYIFLKKYDFAIKLLRTLSERTADPQKIVNIYQEVLLMIPLDDRIDLPVEEMRFVLEKYSYWVTHFTVPSDVKAKALDFFETQIRELGTRSHDLAKKHNEAVRRGQLYERARVFYHLYLGFFEAGPRTVKIATNLGDVYYNLGNFLESGSFYLRTFAGEFGQPTEKKALIQNAILALQKPATDATFYEQLRSKGLLVKAIKTYMSFDPAKEKDSQLNFTLARTYYEQGLYGHALEDLLKFIRRYPNQKETLLAAEMILHYFNTRADYKGVADWAEKILALNVPNPELKARMQEVKSKAVYKRMDESIKEQKGFDRFAQGKSYLQFALESGDEKLKSAALEQALGRAKAEKDVETFFNAATAMAKNEKSGTKRVEIINSVASESLAIGRYLNAIKTWEKLQSGGEAGAVRQTAYDKSLRSALMLRDLGLVTKVMASGGELAPATQSALRQRVYSALDSPVKVPEALVVFALRDPSLSADDILTLQKARTRFDGKTGALIEQRIAEHCRGGRPECRRNRWPETARKIAVFHARMDKTPANMQSIEPSAQALAATLDEIKSFENSGDPQLDAIVALASFESYAAFARFLERTAQANKEVAALLMQKAKESAVAATKSRDRCVAIVNKTSLPSPTAKNCQEGRLVSLGEGGGTVRLFNAPRLAEKDPHDGRIPELEKKVFVDRKDGKLLLELAEEFLSRQHFHHAAAAAAYGETTFKEHASEFAAVEGCALVHLGLFGEGKFYLETKAGDYNDHKRRCLDVLKKNQAGI